jgi:hypothetical protein
MLQRLDVKLVLAAISGALVTLLGDLHVDEEQLGGVLLLLYEYGLAGALFAIPILWPYLRIKDHFLLRGLALIVASNVSFQCAGRAFDWIPDAPIPNPELPDLADAIARAVPKLTDFIVASIVGAAIVFIAAKYIVPFNWSMRYLLFGLIAGLVGGQAFSDLDSLPGPDLIFSFIAWHCIVCAALHFGTQRVGESVHA